MRRRFLCKCKKDVTTNTLKTHLKSPSCSADDTWKKWTLDILESKTKNTRAWLKALGEEANADTEWFLSVISGKTSIEDWLFSSPRPQGVVKPSTLIKFSKNRAGSNNPCSRKRKRDYDINTLKSRAKELFQSVLLEDCPSLGQAISIFSKEFPDVWYQFEEKDDMLRGGNKKNKVFAKLIEIEIEELIKIGWKSRGKFISKGQKDSEKFIRFASARGAALMSSWRITKPHQRLFDLVKFFDETARIEHKLYTHDGRQKSYDIYSPKINTLIEMHGRVWHDTERTKKGIENICKKNSENDKIKESLAKNSGFRYVVFWDDEEPDWDLKLKEIYGTQNN